MGFMVDSEAKTGEIPDEVQALLTSDRAPILITGGTGMYLGANFYKVGAEACRLLHRRGILVTQHQEQVPNELPDSVRRFTYLPFGKLMARVGAVIHHGGRGTLILSILCPILPIFPTFMASLSGVAVPALVTWRNLNPWQIRRVLETG